jgi:hypothetical protein
VTDSDRKMLMVRLAQLAEVFGRSISQTALLGYVRALEDHSLRTLDTALTKAMQSCKRFPSPAEIRELCRRDDPAPTRSGFPQLPGPGEQPLTRASMIEILRDVAARDARGEYTKGGARAKGSQCEGRGKVAWMSSMADELERGETLRRTGNVFADTFVSISERALREPGEDDDEEPPPWMQ